MHGNTNAPANLGYKLDLKLNGQSKIVFDGKENKSLDISLTSINAAPADHISNMDLHISGDERNAFNLAYAHIFSKDNPHGVTTDQIGAAKSVHTHTKSQITDFPASLPASDVLAWAKATTKPSYTWDEINGKPTSFTPATHTHAISNITSLQSILDGKVPYRNISGEDISLNDFRTLGIYYGGGGNVVKDKPPGVDSFGLFIYNTAGAYTVQDLIAGNTNPGKRYTRVYANSVWSDWLVLPIFTTMPESGKVLISNDALGGIKTSPYTIAASVPSDAKFTDTIYTHPNSGTTAGTFKSVTVNTQGHVTGGTNPTTLAGYGITDAAASNHVHITPTKAVSTNNTSTTNKDKYCKIASFKISSLYGYTNIKYDCSLDSHGSTYTDYLELGVWCKQQNAFGNNPYVYLSLMRNNKAIKYVKFFAVIDELDATYSKVDLYAQITISSCLCTLFELSNVCGGITKVDYFNSSEFLDNLPVDKTVIAETDCSAMHDHSGEYAPPNGSTSISKLGPIITLGDGGIGTIFQNSGNVQQKILISDHDLNGGGVYTFQLSTNSGSTFTNLMSITDDGTVKANNFDGNATSATKLQAARKIGNANFNGMTDISLSDIGAAANNHTHSEIAPVSITSVTVNIDDYNHSDGTKMAFYIEKTNGGAANITGTPVAGMPFTLVVESIRWATNTDYITKQTFTSSQTKAVYERYCTNGTWSAWLPVAKMTVIPVSGQVIISDGITGGIKSSGFTIAASVPSDAKFTDTVYTHPNSGATAGTYKSVTVNAQGHITAGTNPTTLSGYGITDAALASHTHTKSQITDMPTKLSAFANDVGYLTNSGTPETFVMGTQSATTGIWTGVLNLPAIYHGLNINYWLPYTGNGNATLNLTLLDGSSTGPINCYFRGTTALTTHYPAGSVISLTYLEKVAISGSGTYTGWWASADYDTNDYYRLRYQQSIKCGSTSIVAGNIIVGNENGYQHLKLGTAFDIRYPIMYANTAISASSTGSDNYLLYPFTVTTTQALTLVAYRPVYIKGNLSGTVFTPASTAPLTQSDPTSVDGYQYLLLGMAYSTTAMYLLIEHPIYEYRDGVFQECSRARRNVIVTVPSSGWSSTAPYTQTISVPGIVSTDEPTLFGYTTKDMTQADIDTTETMVSYISDGYTANGSITLYCLKFKPGSNFNIILKDVT